MVFRAAAAALALAFAIPPGGQAAEASLTKDYRETANRIVEAAMADTVAYEKLTYLTLNIGNRLSGSKSLERAIDWAYEGMREEKLENVRKLPVRVPHWERGRESARTIAPVVKPIAILGLGGSIATPDGGVTAPVVAVESFEELAALGRDGVQGKIVLYAVPWLGYRETVRYRASGASRASDLGAVAALVRSATGRSLYTPHTGSLRYDDGSTPIPAAAVTVEDAEWMAKRISAGEEVRVELSMEARALPDAESFNVVAEIVGREKPEEVVVMGGHIDSWDVGQGAHDDGAACMAAWQALVLLRKLGLTPRRTLRLVLWTNEENGLRGARAYRDFLEKDVSKHVAAIEMDGGAEKPIGFGLGLRTGQGEASDAAYEEALGKLRAIGDLLSGIEASEISRGGGGADIAPLMEEGVPGLGLRTVGDHYFDWHHTEADTLDKVDPDNLRRAIALLAVMGYVLADMEGTLKQVASE